MLKKISLVVIGFASSQLIWAGTMGPVCTPGNVTVPCVAKMWDLGIQALYLQSIYGTDKGYVLGTSNNYQAANSDWSLGFRAEGSYHFNTGNDVTIDWTHFSSNSDGFSLPTIPSLSPIIPYINENRIDQVNLVMGQHVDVGLVKKMRFYGGLQYANIEAHISRFDQIPFQNVITSRVQRNNSELRGLGPVIGMDYSYNLTHEFSLTANAQGSILCSTSRYYNGFVLEPVGINIGIQSGSRKALVPSIAAKLGVNYAYSIAQGVLNFEGGYQAMDYIGAIQAQTFQSTTGLIHDSDYGLYGPYLGVKYLGNA